jgi:hypothetical protein
MQDVPLTIEFKGRQFIGFAVPLGNSMQKRPTAFDIIIDKAFLGTLRQTEQGWKMDTEQDPEFLEILGKYILGWYAPGSELREAHLKGSSAAGPI